MVLWAVSILLGVLIVWASIAKLDIVAVANGRLVPKTYVKIVQPAEAGVIREILVEEGDWVEQDQVLVRLDPTVNGVDSRAVADELALAVLELRRIESELSDAPFARAPDDAPDLFAQVEARLEGRRQAYRDALAQEQAARRRAARELDASREMLEKFQAALPTYEEAAQAYETLAEQQLVGAIEAMERRREALERAQDVEAQRAMAASLEASVGERDQRLAQIRSNYVSGLHDEKLQTVTSITRLKQQLGRLDYQERLLELRAPQGGIVKDLATTTVGAVVQPGTVLLNLVPQEEPLLAEVLIENQDIGFVAADQAVRVKLAAYEFQKYGMLDGVLRTISADSSVEGTAEEAGVPARFAFKALVELDRQQLEANGLNLPLAAGMQVTAEIKQGTRTVIEYLLSPVQRVASEAGMER
jgi:HlyD family secretion protein